MSYPIKFPTSSDHVEYYDEVSDLYKEAINYLTSFDWCSNVEDCYLYLNLGEKLCVFLFKIDNLASSDDNFLWVLVGDLPPAYLDIHGARSTGDVLDIYVALAENWIDNVKNGKSIDDCFPFQAQPTVQMAELLEAKISFIKNVVTKNISDIHLHINS